MKKVFAAACLTVMCLCLPLQAARAHRQTDYIRLHILAESDSAHDQAVKLLVRDEIREYTSELLKESGDADAAWALLQENESVLLNVACTAAKEYGYAGSISVELGVFDFPDRTYGDEFVPAGEYRAVRILLSEGQGRNWWCVVYPSLCLPEDADIDQPIEFYSSILRWIRRMREVIAA